MTVEEIEILVTAKVEEALKEFEKIVPSMKKQMKQVQETFSKVDTKAMTSKLHQAVNFMKKKMLNLKKSSENNEIAIKVTNKDAQKQISQIQKQIDSLQEKINARQMKLNIILPRLDKIANIEEVEYQGVVTAKGVSQKNKITNNINNSKEFQRLSAQEEKLVDEIRVYSRYLDEAKSKMSQLEQETNKTSTTQNKLSSFFGTFKKKIEQTKPSITSMKNSFSGMPKVTQNITNNIKNIGNGLKNGLGNILKYTGALLSLRGIYFTLSSCAQSWLSSQNAGAKQLSANIDYMKYAMGSVFAPIIQYVTSLVYQLMKAIQSVAYALTGVNIFAKATANSMNKTAGSASKASKSLSGIHNEINNVSDSNSGGESGSTTPSMDLSQMDTEMSSFSQKLYDFFKPLVDSWNTYGGGLIEQIKTTASQIIGLISSVWGSFENIIANGTVYSIFENILAIIGNIAEAFANAWQNNGNGDVIVQNLANTFNNLLEIIEKITQSTVFQWILDIGVLAIEKLTEAVEWVTQKVNEFVGFLTGSNDKLDGWAIVVGSIATAIGLVVGALIAYNVIAGIAAIVTAVLTSPITLVVLAIAALIAIVVLLIKNWDKVKETAQKCWEGIKNVFSGIGSWFKDKFQDAYNGIKNVFSNIGKFFSGIWNGIKNTFSKLGTSIGNAISNSVKSGINGVISLIERTINSAIRLINGGIGMINLIPGVSVGTINTLSLPRLAKGGVLTQATAVVAGEYSGARTNPEIVTPQNIMRDTFEDVLSNYSGNNNDRPIYLTVNVGDKKLGQILLDNLRDMKRQTGKDIEAIIGD